MKPFKQVTSQVIPLPLKEVDTDMIIPAQFLTSVSKEGYGENLFKRLKSSDPNFPFNLEKYQKAEILVADSNFGCGSSREHAVWALLGAGIRVVIAKSFADIFFSNSAKNGLLLVTLGENVVDEILSKAANEQYVLSVDLVEQTVKLPDGKVLRFDYDPFRKHCMLNGLDDIDYILDKKNVIEDFKTQRKAYRYFSTLD
jgi:3-isopropylmalate/(R)-2-methylmalate dehydratase small subunit